MDKPTVLIIATLDTKSAEVGFLRERIHAAGADTLVMDAGILGEPQGIAPEVGARETARAAGATLEELRGKGVRGLAIEVMLKGLTVLTEELYRAGRIQGAISMGGAEGGVMAAAAMQTLPPGFPKIIITPLASGVRPFGPFIGIRDIMVMHSLIDIAGLNDISRAVFANAGAAIAGMAKAYRPLAITAKNLVAITTLGTTEAAMRVLEPLLRRAGFEPIVFHSSGVGGQVMEDMIRRGYFRGVVDLCPNELTDHLVGAYHDAGPHRLEAAAELGVPQVVCTGCMDFFAQGPRETVPEKWRDRRMYYHNPKFTLIRPSRDEMVQIARDFCRKLNRAKGPLRVVLPLGGMSYAGLPGGDTHDPEGDAAFFATIKAGLRPDIPLRELAAHVNEEITARTLAEEFIAMLRSA